jgi:gliding motility-associated-like protein
MREKYFLKYLIPLFLLIGSNAFSQQNSISAGAPNLVTSAVNTACNCWIDRDATWNVVHFLNAVGPDFRNDDASSDSIILPFTLCFYGQNVNKVYINNNGNVSIGAPYTTFTANQFPDSTYKMIAPFWSDVDTRGPLSGLVYYKIAPKYMIVQWENVGYYNTHDDKLNTFQLIITDGSDPIINLGQNVAFCYKDMTWTTGDITGVNGYGTPATVGANEGNGVDYIQFGLFDAPGTAYDGPYGSNDGVDWLDGQSFTLNTCISSSNIPPVLNSISVCDTIRLCENSTYNLTANYLSPEAGQSTHINFFAFGMQGVNVVSNSPGPTATLDLQIVASQANIGFHTISVSAIDNGAPAAATTNNFVIEVMPAAMAGFTYTPAQYIQTTTPVTFNNTTAAAAGVSYSWDFGDTSPADTSANPNHTYAVPGTYTATLTATYSNGCVTTTSQTILVCGPVSFTTTNQCVGDPSTISLNSPASSGTTYTWDFAGGTVLSGSGGGPYTVSWSSAGTFNVTLIASDAQCAAADTQSVTINAAPVAAISSALSVCLGDTPNINFNGTAGATANYTWNFGNAGVLSGSGAGPYAVQFNTAGNDVISLIVDENGCSDTTNISVLVNAIPTATFGMPPSACAFEPIQITYSGTAGPAATYTWNFDNGVVSSGSGAGPYSVNWSTGGNFNVTLTVTENGCTSASALVPVTITASPVVTMSNIAPVCEGGTANVNFNGTAGPSAIYTWNFGSASVISGSGSGPYSLQWIAPGQQQIILSVTDNNCTSSDTMDVTVNAIPTSVFTIDNSACVNNGIGITYAGSAVANATYNWTFGNATLLSGSGQGPYSVAWNAPGSYQVSLIVTENNCVSAQTDLFATVNPLPVALAGVDQASCSGVLVPLGDISAQGLIYNWTPASDLSDPTISNPAATIQNTTNSDIQRNYIVTVTDVNGCVNTDTVTVSTHPVPVIGFAGLPGQCIENNLFNFSAFSSVAGNMNYTWAFSGPASTSSSNQAVEHVSYSSVGTYPVMLTGDYIGCPAQPYVDSVEVYAMPVPDFTALNIAGCRPLTVSFSNLTAGSGNTYGWKFGDGGTDNIADPVYTYNSAGAFNVVLTARNAKGCTMDTTYNNFVNVYPDAIANFLPSPPVANILAPLVHFQDYSANAYTYVWDFGDSTPRSSEPSPEHIYSAIGTYEVTLMIASANGCVDTVRGLVKVEDNFTLYIPGAFTPNGDGVNDLFRAWGVAIDSYSMRIYNRWGDLIFNTNDINTPWDGRKKGGEVQNDTYVYHIEVVDLHGEKHTYVGDVSVIY